MTSSIAPYPATTVHQAPGGHARGRRETVIVGTHDLGIGAVAKDWQALPRWDDLPVTIETERYAIDALLHTGGRNVSPGEPAGVGSDLAQIQFVTPRGLRLLPR
jgi:hypothetical protein